MPVSDEDVVVVLFINSDEVVDEGVLGLLRFSLLAYLNEDTGPDFPCEIFEVLKLGNYREFWVRCYDICEVLHLLEQVSSLGSVLAFGGLTGLVRKSLPTTQREFLEFVSGHVILDKGSEVIVEILGSLTEATNFLVSVSSKLQIDIKSRIAKTVLTRPASTTSFFDSRLRLLKPLEIPPKLTKTPSRASRFKTSLH